MIASEQQAEQIGAATGQPFKVFRYVDQRSNLTMFGVEVGERIITNPRAAVPAHSNERTTNGNLPGHS